MLNMVLNVLVAPVIAQQAPPPGSGNPLITLLPFVLMIAAMWFLMIAPQRKKQKEHQRLINSLASGDEVLTAGGIYGTVTNVKNDRIVVRIAEGTKVEIGRAFVQAVEKKAASSDS